jgi:Restriction endonuclease fold toxin 9
VSAVLSLCKPHRIKASHRRRWKGTTGHSVYIMNNPLSGTDPTGYAISCMMNDICNLQNELYGQNGARNDIYKKFALDGNAKKDNGSPGQKTASSTFESFKKDPVASLKQMYNDFTSINDGKQLNDSGSLNDRARLAEEGDVIGGSNANNKTQAHRDLERNLHTTKVVAEVSGKVVETQLKDPLTYAGPVFKLLAGIKILAVAVKLEKAEDAGSIVLKGSRNPKVAEAAALGRLKHKEWLPGEGFKKEVRLPSGKQADAVNYKTREVVELKPNNPNAVRRGEKQVEGYRKELENVTGECWTCRVETYNK